jgi:hypothetical protein
MKTENTPLSQLTPEEVKVVNQVLAVISRRFDATPAVLAALKFLHQVCLAQDAENQMERPTEEEYQSAMAMASSALLAAEHQGLDGKDGVRALSMLAMQAADYYDLVLTVEQVPLQPLAMGHYFTTATLSPKRVMAEKGGAA